MRHGSIGALALAAFRVAVSVLALATLAAASVRAADWTAYGTAETEVEVRGKSKRIYGIRAIAPGMNQTELQSVMGPPDYIQVNGPRQAWQYCPHFLERIRVRRGDLVQSLEHLFARRDGDFFVTVFFLNGQVQHMRAYPEEAMGNCADFYAAFRWEDIIDGEYVGLGGYGMFGGFNK